MDRLTKNDLNKVCYDPWEICGMDRHCTKGCHDDGGCTKGCHILKMYMKLANYEDAEEQGLFLRLPCKIGDKVYRICGPKGRKYVDYRIVCSITYRLDFNANIIWEIHSTTTDVLGDTVFLTKEQAENKLFLM